ncbi:MAG: VanW family protein, partial [Thermomicrobiales bacterium]
MEGDRCGGASDRAAIPTVDPYLRPMRIPRPQTTPLTQIGETVQGSIRPLHGYRLTRLATRRQALLGATVGSAALVAAVFPLGLRGRILPGPSIGDVDVSGLTAGEARHVLRERADALTSQPIDLRIGDRTFPSTLAELGFSVNLDASIDHALARSRDEGVTGQYVHGLGLDDGTVVPVAFSVDNARLERALTSIAREVDTVARPASLVVDGATLVLDEGAAGMHIDPASARGAVLDALSRWPVTIIEVPAGFQHPTPSAAELEPAFIHAQTLTATPVTLAVDGATWDIPPDDLLGALVIPADPLTEAPSLDLAKLRAVLPAAMTDGVSQHPRNTRLGVSGASVKVIADAVPGRTFDLDATAKAVATAAASSEGRQIDAVFHETPAKVRADTLAELGLVARIAKGTSSFGGSSEERRVNVVTAAELITESLVAPGETWSFLRTLGPISVENGFAVGRGFGASWFESGVGGGVCQISTTVFRAALFGALPIPEWYSHAYRFAYYEQMGEPVGLDCAVYQPDTDEQREFDFVIGNPTASWMYLQLTIEGEIVTAEVFGAPLDYEAEVLPPYVGDPIPPAESLVEVDDSMKPGEEKLVETA